MYKRQAYVIVDGKVIKMEGLNESQLRAQAVRMFEENYSYCVIAKKLSHAKGWVSKWIRRWKTNPVKSLQSQSRWQLTNKTGLNLTAQRIIRNSKYQTCTSHREIGLQIRQICLRLKTFGALWLQ